MVTPIFIIAIALGTAFFLGFTSKKSQGLAFGLMYLALGAMSFISLEWLYYFFSNPDAASVQVFTAGFKPPFSINLQMGKYEAIFTALVNLSGLLGGIYLFDLLKQRGKNALMVFLLFFMGLDVIIMTRDIFNLFVFLEVESIALAGLIIYLKNERSFSAGFKYMIASGIIAGLLLIGIIFVYYFTGSLNLDDIMAANIIWMKGGAVAVFLIIVAVLLELKPFPANGWALDVYTAAHPGIGALVSAASATGGYFVLLKLLPLIGGWGLQVVAVAGLITFVASNFMGLRQGNTNRLLGYSSLGQIGLLVSVAGLQYYIGEKSTFIILSILLTHYLAKAGLFWLSGLIGKNELKDWSVLRKKPILLFLFGVFIFALAGFPPFPAFFGKWSLIMELAAQGQYWWMVLILLGAFFEVVYLLRWFGYTTKLQAAEDAKVDMSWYKLIPIGIFGFVLLVTAYLVPASYTEFARAIDIIPLFFIGLLFAIDFVPAFVKNILTIGGLGYYGYTLLPEYMDDRFRLIFLAIFILGGALLLIAGFSQKGARKGFYPFVAMMFAGLIGLIQAENTLTFFFSWEIMAMGSYFLIMRGKNAMKPGLRYMLFSVGGAYVLMAGFALAYAGNFTLDLNILSSVLPQLAPWIFILLMLGFMVKAAAIGLHIWLPGAYAEAESDVTPLISGIQIKSGIFGLMLVLISMGTAYIGNVDVAYIIGWIGAITALGGNMLAVYQEDVKKLIAYSSVGAMGAIIFALAMMSHMGWMTAMTYTINHFLYKSLIFLAIGGVIYRVKTRNMYEMGGLIKRMPLSFIAVLIGIITLAGIPPLSGFAGKWLFYNAVIMKGWYFQGTVVFFAGIIAFLFLFKMISSVFLGQEKDNLRKVKEAPMWFIIPQYILIIGIMVFSMQPKLLLEPIGEMLSVYVPGEQIAWNGDTATTSLGHWNALNIGMVVMAMFAILLIWLLINSRKAQKVKQFDIVFAGEKPFRPETTHVSYNMFAHYNKALGFAVIPLATRFWLSVRDLFMAVAGWLRTIYNGNGQTYAMHVVLYVVLFFIFIMGGF